MVQQLLLTFTSLVVAMAIGLPLALYAGHRRRGGFLAVNVSNVGRAVPVFAVLLVLSLGPIGSEQFGPFGRAGLATLDLAGPLRAAAADHQRLRRDHRGRPRHHRGLARHGHGRGQGVLVRRAPARDAGHHDRRPPRAGAGVGDRHHRGPGRRARAGPDHHARVRQPGHRGGGRGGAARRGRGAGPRRRRRPRRAVRRPHAPGPAPARPAVGSDTTNCYPTPWSDPIRNRSVTEHCRRRGLLFWNGCQRGAHRTRAGQVSAGHRRWCTYAHGSRTWAHDSSGGPPGDGRLWRRLPRGLRQPTTATAAAPTRAVSSSVDRTSPRCT